MTQKDHGTHKEVNGMVKVGDTVKVIQGEVAIIGKVTAVDEFRVVFTEEYAASVWGESDACAGRVHSVSPLDIEDE
jgi:hypothetical protein